MATGNMGRIQMSVYLLSVIQPVSFGLELSLLILIGLVYTSSKRNTVEESGKWGNFSVLLEFSFL